METRFMKRAFFGAVGAAAALFAGVAQAALLDRDLNGDTVVDAFYDTDLGITWLRDANANGLMDWSTALAWADGYSFGGYSDWRLPKGDLCEEAFCTDTDMGHLWYVEWGNPRIGDPNPSTGDFKNVEHGYYWTSTEYTPEPYRAVIFYPHNGGQYSYPKDHAIFAMAVRDGDVSAVPEPQTYALLMPGLTVLAVRIRRPPH